MSIYKILMNYFSDLISEHNLDDEEIFVSIKSLTEKSYRYNRKERFSSTKWKRSFN